MNAKPQKLKFTEKLGFGLGEVPSIGGAIISSFLVMFYTDQVGMNPGVIGTMIFISRIMDGITDLIAGTVVDKTRTKWGKARPWLLWLCVPTGLAYILTVLIPLNASPTVQLVYAFLTYNLYVSILYTMTGVAKAALMPRMSMDGVERGKLARFSLFFGMGGAVAGMAVTFPFIMKMGGNVRAWRTVFIVYGILITLSLFISFLTTKEYVTDVGASEPQTEKGKNKGTFIEGIKLFAKNKYCVLAVGTMLILNVALNVGNNCQTYIYTYVMNDQMMMTTMNLFNLIPMLIGIMFLSGWSLRTFGKRNSVFVGAGMQILGYFILFIATGTMNTALFAAGIVIKALGSGPLSVPINVLSADAIDYGEYKFGKRIEGVSSSVVTFSNKISQGIGTAILGWTLSLTGFVANEVQSGSVIMGLRSLFSLVPLIMLVALVIIFVAFYDYDKKESEVVGNLMQRRGQTASGSPEGN